jgi:hypothetical protein
MPAPVVAGKPEKEKLTLRILKKSQNQRRSEKRNRIFCYSESATDLVAPQ